MLLCFFFFQAEDGIRDAQESRGLGDVYKRQVYVLAFGLCFSQNDRILNQLNKPLAAAKSVDCDKPRTDASALEPVSYTHLTLPTIYSV